MPGTTQDIVCAGLIISRKYWCGNDHTKQQHQKTHDVLIIHDRGSHARINLKGLLCIPVHFYGFALCPGAVRLFHLHQGGNPALTDGIVVVNLLQINFHNRRGHSGIRICKGLLYTVEQRGNGEYLPLIDALRQIIGFRHAVGCKAGLIGLHSLPHPLWGNDSGCFRLPFLFMGDGCQAGEIHLISVLVCVITVAVSSGQPGKQNGE